MNVNQIINMVMRLFLRKAINTGIDKGVGLMSKRKGGGDASPEQAQQGRDNAKRAKQAMRVGRRVTRL